MRYLGKGSVSSLLGVLLNIAWYTLFLAMGGVLLAMPLVGVFGSRINPHDLGGFLAFDSQFLSFDFSRVEVRDPQAILLGVLGLTLVTLAVAQAVVYQLRRIFVTLRTGTPFSLKNAGRIRAIGLTVIGGSFLQSLVAFIAGILMMNNLVIPGVALNVKSNFHLSSIFTGLVILVLAEIFRHGAALQEEQDLTV